MEEKEEKKDSSTEEEDFFVDKINDELLGEKIVLIAIDTINIKIVQKAINSISGYKPKIIIQSEQFYFAENNKIDRKKTLFESLKTVKKCLNGFILLETSIVVIL